MKLENGRELLFFPAYYKRRYVNVPLLHLPENAITNEGDLVFYRFDFVDNPVKLDPLSERESKAAKKYFAREKDTIDPNKLSEKVLRNLCKTSDIPIGWVTDRFPNKETQAGEYANRREKRKYKLLTQNEYDDVNRELKKLDAESALIIELLWYLNINLANGGAYITLEEILRMRVPDFTPENEVRPAQVFLKRMGRRNRTHLVSLCIPSKLGKALCRQIKENSLFIFSNRYGGPRLSVKIDADLKRAAKNAGIKEVITSLSLRPAFNKQEVNQSTALNVRRQIAVTDEEWKIICKKVPSINQRRGRKSAYNPRDLLDSILYRLKHKCPFRKLKALPPWRAVASQYRRWTKNGILDAILSCLSEMRSV